MHEFYLYARDHVLAHTALEQQSGRATVRRQEHSTGAMGAGTRLLPPHCSALEQQSGRAATAIATRGAATRASALRKNMASMHAM